MNYDSPTTPRPQNYGKFSARFFFTPGLGITIAALTSASTWIDLGNCTASQQKHGSKSADVMRARRGGSSRVDSPITSVSPELDITLNEVRVRKTIPIRVFGTQGADVVQAAATAQSLTIPAVYQNNSYDLGKRNLANVAVKIGTAAGAAAVQDVDYQIDPVFGMLTIMEGAIPDSTVATPSAIVVTFDNAAFTRASFTEYSVLNAYGIVRWFQEDTFGNGAAIEKACYCNLKPQDLGAADPTKYSDDKITAILLGTVARLDRKD